MPWSAQWMSSNASTSGLRRPIASIPNRTAEKKDSRMRAGSITSAVPGSSGTSIPSSRPIRAARRSRASGWTSSVSVSPSRWDMPVRSLSQAASEESPSTMPNSARTTSPSAQ